MIFLKSYMVIYFFDWVVGDYLYVLVYDFLF